ncbi:hypothetical protein ACA910_002882 [Epithemia clementina (nom. ined.)]
MIKCNTIKQLVRGLSMMLIPIFLAKSFRTNLVQLQKYRVNNNSNNYEQYAQLNKEHSNELDHDEESCRHVAAQIAAASDSRLEMNRIRRMTYLASLQINTSNLNRLEQGSDSTPQKYVVNCFEKYFPLFRQSFLNHHEIRGGNGTARGGGQRSHTMLHIPKTGGTSLCNLVKEKTKWRVPNSNSDNNCQPKAYSSYWCCWDGVTDRMHANRISCQDQEAMQLPYDLYMNENWLDKFCPQQQTHSIILREPVSRAMSHDNHLTQFDSARGDMAWRRTLVQSNYMTWSLAADRFWKAGKSNYTNSSNPEQSKKRQKQLALTAQKSPPVYLFRPSNQTHLEEALYRLSQMDFLLDLKHLDESCTQLTLQFMGLTEPELPRNGTANTGSSPNQTSLNEKRGRPKGLSIPRANQAEDPAYLLRYNRSDFVRRNQLDSAFYQQAQQWMDADCDFFHRIAPFFAADADGGQQQISHTR